MPLSPRSRRNCRLLVVTAFSVLIGLLWPGRQVPAQEEKAAGSQAVPQRVSEEARPAAAVGGAGAKKEGYAISFPADDVEKGLREAAASVSEQARPLFHREPLGFDLGTIGRLREWIGCPWRSRI